ncbi:MAG: M20 metallopeptidase family protein [Eubacteriales bacterium]|jgi:amidohydrolase
MKIEVDQSYMSRVRRTLHQNPEAGIDLPQTAAFVANELRAMDIPFSDAYGRSSLVATLNPAHPGPALALRADMDALPIPELSDTPYCSRIDGVSHACGHDLHTAILLGTLRALLPYRDVLPVRLVALFQSGEETGNGARLMIEDGVCELFDQAAALHIDNQIDVGQVRVFSGPTLACCGSFKLVFHGLRGHAAAPQTAVDALAMGVRAYDAMLRLAAQELHPAISCVLTVTSMNAGILGNIIPDVCELCGTIRTHSDEAADYLCRRIPEVADAVCREFTIPGFTPTVDAKCSIYTPVVYSNPTCADRLADSAVRAGAEVLRHTQPDLYAEDFALFARERPSVFFFLGGRNEAKGFTSMTHSPAFDADEDCLSVGASIFCQYVLSKW